jgi:hypothetical protein
MKELKIVKYGIMGEESVRKVGRKYIALCETDNVLWWSFFYVIQAFPVSRIDFCSYPSRHLVFRAYMPVADQALNIIHSLLTKSQSYTYIPGL